MMLIKQIRDISLIDIDENRYLGVACDSCGAIGEKEHDMVKASPIIVGEQTAKVVLAELLSMGFEPMLLSDGLSVEMEDTGRKIIEGFTNTIKQLRNSKVHLTGSTEENMKTVQTSMGVTGIGIVDKNKLKYKKSSAGDLCVAVGLPFVGYDVLKNLDKVMSIEDFETISMLDYVKEIIPVGSKGAGHEINELCNCNSLSIKYKENLSYNLNCSGGPSCSCILSINEQDLPLLKKLIDKPIETLGTFILA